MFTISTPIPRARLSDVLNFTVADIIAHGGDALRGFRFMPRGDSAAYLKVPGDPRGAVCVYLSEGDSLASIFYHPSRGGREAWELSATDEGCRQLATDEDMDEDKAWANSAHEPYSPPRLGSPVGLYEVVYTATRYFR